MSERASLQHKNGTQTASEPTGYLVTLLYIYVVPLQVDFIIFTSLSRSIVEHSNSM
jgi:hypothetical protein